MQRSCAGLSPSFLFLPSPPSSPPTYYPRTPIPSDKSLVALVDPVTFPTNLWGMFCKRSDTPLRGFAASDVPPSTARAGHPRRPRRCPAPPPRLGGGRGVAAGRGAHRGGGRGVPGARAVRGPRRRVRACASLSTFTACPRVAPSFTSPRHSPYPLSSSVFRSVCSVPPQGACKVRAPNKCAGARLKSRVLGNPRRRFLSARPSSVRPPFSPPHLPRPSGISIRRGVF